MLVLSRKLGEKIVIGQDVVLSVLEVRGDTVKLGIQAPRHVSIHREEVFQEIIQANQQAFGGQMPADKLSDTLQKAGEMKRRKPTDANAKPGIQTPGV